MLFMLKTIAILLSCAILTGCTAAGESIPFVAAGTWFNHDRRDAKTIIDDQAITVKANLAIAKNKQIWKDSHVSTLSYNNTLLLVGQTKSQVYKQQIEKIVQPISGLGTIYNQITVGPLICLQTRANDTWITTQVKARIISNRNVGINRVKVITEDSVVYLMGALTPDEEQTTIDIARRVPCVKKVITIVEREVEPKNIDTERCIPCEPYKDPCDVPCKDY
jgi:osmotically-inducible protein OsmY